MSAILILASKYSDSLEQLDNILCLLSIDAEIFLNLIHTVNQTIQGRINLLPFYRVTFHHLYKHGFYFFFQYLLYF